MNRAVLALTVAIALAKPTALHAGQIVGTDGPERITGTPARDTINGKGGNDLVFARAGDDRINVRDRRQDTVSCGPGTDTVKADVKDRVNSDCETVRRPASPAPARTRPGYSDIYNCDDFPLPDGTTAQDYLDLYPSDPSGLDGNHDGVACEGS